MTQLSREEYLRIIVSKGIVTEPGVHRMRVTHVHPYVKMHNGGVKQVAICNFNTKTLYHEEVSISLCAQGDYKEAANQGLSMSILEGQFIPKAGQIVDVEIEEKPNKDGVLALFAQRCALAPVMQPVKRTMEEFLAITQGSQADFVSVLAEEEQAVPFPQ